MREKRRWQIADLWQCEKKRKKEETQEGGKKGGISPVKWGKEKGENLTAIQLDLLVQGRDAGNWSTCKSRASETFKSILISDRKNQQLT